MVEGRGRVSPNMFNWNWFQCMENNMDTSHQGILHFGAVPLEDALDPVKAQQAYAGPVEDLKYIVGNRATTFIVKDTDFGCSYGAYRPGEPDSNYFRTMHWLFPWVTMTPVIKLGQRANCVDHRAARRHAHDVMGHDHRTAGPAAEHHPATWWRTRAAAQYG